jgi:hypothetical protein
MSSERDILYTHQNVGKYFQDRENARVRKEMEDGVQPVRREKQVGKNPEIQQPQDKSVANEQTSDVLSSRARREAHREALIEGNYSAFEIMQADMDLRRTMHDSYEDECCGKDF